MTRLRLLLPFLLVISGCNPYSQFYTGRAENILDNPKVIIPMDAPTLKRGFDAEADMTNMLENGYALIGYSSFNAGYANENGALEQAKKVHADTVIVYTEYSHKLSGSMPITAPTYHSGTIYDSGGFASYSGTSYTTTYVPYNVERYDYFATYWVKMKPPSLGIYFDDLTDELRKKVGSNKGIYITVVVKGSPAFNADLLSGDIIRKLNDTEVIDMAHFSKLGAENKEQQIKLEVFRDGKTIIKQIQLN